MRDRAPNTPKRPATPPENGGRRSNPLLWILVLLALLAFGWFIYNQSADRGPALDAPPPTIGSGDAREAAAERERAASESTRP